MGTLEIAALSMKADLDRLQGIGNNLANVSTPGYKRLLDTHESFASAIDEAAGAAQRAQPAATLRDMSAGALRATGRALDLVVQDDGFLELRTAKGTVYSRGGSFQLDAQGRVTLGAGQVLQLVGGDLKTPGAESDIAIDAQGQVSLRGEAAGRLRLVRFDAPAALVAVGGGLYEAGAARVVDDTAQAAVRTGHLESSNVQSTQEMVRLLETSRHFESMQKVIQGYDEALGTAIRKLGEI